MVDPNRKINRFTDSDIEFLEECEREFSNRFSEQDAEFVEYCKKPLADPPILENNSSNSSSSSGAGHSYQYNRRGGRPNRGWRGHAGEGGGNRNYSNHRGGRGGGRFYDNQNGYEHQNQNPRRETYTRNKNPTNIRRDYSNFVAATKEE